MNFALRKEIWAFCIQDLYVHGNRLSLAQEICTPLPEHHQCYKELQFLKKYELC